MPLSMSEKIKIMLKRRNMTMTQLAETIGQSRQNLSNKMNRNNFSERELEAIANALDCTYTASFTMNDSGETL